MKKLSLLLCLLLPLWGLAADVDKNDCDRMIDEGDAIYQKALRMDRYRDSLQTALNKYLDALTCNSKKGDVIKRKIKLVYTEIDKDRRRMRYLYQKSENLLSLFFNDKDSVHRKEAAWALGPNGKYAVINRDGEIKGDGFIWLEPQTFIITDDSSRAIAKRGGELFFVNEEGEAFKREGAKAEGFDFLHPTTTPHYFGIQQVQNLNREMVLDGVNGLAKDRIRMLRDGFDRASENFFPFQDGAKWKLMDDQGNEFADCFDTLTKVYEGYAAAKKGDKWGFIDTTGQVARWGFDFDSVGIFADKIAWTLKDGTYQLIFSDPGQDTVNASGKSLIAAYESYFKTHIFSGEFRNQSMPLKQVPASYFTTSLPFKIAPNSNFAIIRKPGEKNVLSLFQKREKFGLQYKGFELIPAEYDMIAHTDSQVYILEKRNQKGLRVYGDIDESRKRTRGEDSEGHGLFLLNQIKPDFQDLGEFQLPRKTKDGVKHPAYVRVKQNGKWGYVFWEEEGKTEPSRTIKPQYDLATDFFDRNGQEVALVYIEKYSLYFYINRSGQMLTRIERNKIW